MKWTKIDIDGSALKARISSEGMSFADAERDTKIGASNLSKACRYNSIMPAYLNSICIRYGWNENDFLPTKPTQIVPSGKDHEMETLLNTMETLLHTVESLNKTMFTGLSVLKSMQDSLRNLEGYAVNINVNTSGTKKLVNDLASAFTGKEEN